MTVAMRAITITEAGGPDVLAWAEVPDPEPGPGEVLVDVAASAVNRADLLQRQGYYPPPPGASPYPGLECSGVISALGAGVPGWTVGDEVCALLAGGGYAERVAVPAGQLLPVPAGVDLVDAAALPEVACTVWSNVLQLARLRPGETLLVHGGGSGIGTFAIQFGTAIGAHGGRPPPGRPSTSGCGSSGPSRVDRLHAARTSSAPYASETGGRGADVILDIIGAKYLARNVDALADGGRLVIIGMQGGRKAELDIGALMAKRGRSPPPRCGRAPPTRRPRSCAAYATRCGRWSTPEDPADHRPAAADYRGRRSAPAGRVERAHRQGPPRHRLTRTAPAAAGRPATVRPAARAEHQPCPRTLRAEHVARVVELAALQRQAATADAAVEVVAEPFAAGGSARRAGCASAAESRAQSAWRRRPVLGECVEGRADLLQGDADLLGDRG